MSRARNHRWRSSAAHGLIATAAVLFACSMAACGPAETGLQRDTARHLQERVLGVSQAAAANDLSGGLAALDSLEADLASATGTGQVSEDRRRSIITAAAAVRADLTAAMDLAAAAAKDSEDAAAANAAAAEAANMAPAPDAPAPTDGKGNKGKGKDN